jgi:hypothetical protein
MQRLGHLLRMSQPLVLDSTTPYMSIAQQLLLQDVSKDDFHSLWPELYQSADGSDGLAAVSTRFPSRLIGRFNVSIGSKRLWAPMLVDTGAPFTLLSSYTLDRFGVDTIPSTFSAQIGHVRADVSLSPAESHFRHLNILGMDVLREAIPNWPHGLWDLLDRGLRLKAAETDDKCITAVDIAMLIGGWWKEVRRSSCVSADRVLLISLIMGTCTLAELQASHE